MRSKILILVAVLALGSALAISPARVLAVGGAAPSASYIQTPTYGVVAVSAEPGSAFMVFRSVDGVWAPLGGGEINASGVGEQIVAPSPGTIYGVNVLTPGVGSTFLVVIPKDDDWLWD